MYWLGHEELRFIQTLTDSDQENCKTPSGLFKLLSEKFKSCKIRQYCRYGLVSWQQEKMNVLRSGWVTTELKQLSVNTGERLRLKEQFIIGINDEEMVTEIIKALTTIMLCKAYRAIFSFQSRGYFLYLYIGYSLHNFYSSSGLLVFALIGGIIFIVHYIY